MRERSTAHRAPERINRNILECKSLFGDLPVLTRNRINRNILECKSSNAFNTSIPTLVLIETYWNVNRL